MTQCKHQVIDYFNGHIQGEEKAQFEEHLKLCSACKEELEELTSLMSEIPFLADDQAPPAGMKGRILSQVFEEETSETVEEKNDQKKELKVAREPNEVRPMQKKRKQWLLPLVAALLLISAAGNVYFLTNGKEQAEEPVRVVATKSLTSAESPKTAGAFSVIEHNGKKELVVSADGLKGQLDSSAVYQVWLIKGDQPVPAGAFKTDNKGEGTVTYALSEKEASESWDTVAVTLEPKKDNKLPQGPVVLSAAF
ncbi:anti-sigma factor [Bacillus pumilus]|uniref:anti-sigma factor n=1 Tax=Bacillus pumilus TaxID=1408 RepID=UPI0011E90B6B|nr:anti-sigma factor [Bacillus pumilus]TYS34537.1 anti-sigma factor [Bacillus pumilus]TYS51677.1 anti-sigma factor [Bacillus pumilus]